MGFEKALGILESKNIGFDFEIEPTFKDVRNFRKLMLKNTKDKEALFDNFHAYMTELITRFYPSENKDLIEENIELYINKLFEEVMIAYKWTTKEELDKSKQENVKELKKLIEDD